MKTYGIIPARLESTRLPRKLLLAETGKPLIQHTWEAVCRAKSLDAVIVATDSAEIAAAVRAFGGRVEMTGQHPSGTDRCAEVARRLPDAELIVNIQGDEPEIDPGHIDELVLLMFDYEGLADMGTLAATLLPDEIGRPSCVKVITDCDGWAVHFTRGAVPARRHVGTYAYRPQYLDRLASLPQTEREYSLRLEQMRAVDDLARIIVGSVPFSPPGIDTPEDYRRFVGRCHACV